MSTKDQPQGSVQDVKIDVALSEFETWLIGNKGKGEKTASDYRTYARRYIEYWDEIVPEPAEEKLTLYNTDYLRTLNKSASVKNATIRAVEYYYECQGMDASIDMRYQRENTSPPCLSQSQYQDILIKGAQRKRDVALVLFLGSSGARASEVCRIKLGDISWSNNKVEGIQLKGGKTGDYNFSDDAKTAMREYLKSRNDNGLGDPEDPLFTSISTGEPLTRHGLLQAVHRMADRAGLDTSDDNICVHGFRGYFITQAYEKGRNLERIRRWVNHESVEMTARYVGEGREKVDKERYDSMF